MGFMKIAGGEGNTNRGVQGYLYTISAILLISPLIVLILFHTAITRINPIEDTAKTVRCDELYYFVGDVEYDLERAMLIFGRRAAVYATDSVVTDNRPMYNYSFTPCSSYDFYSNGSEAAIAELVLCGTLYGDDVLYMSNHTLPIWIERIYADAEEMNYDINITVHNLSVVPYDAWGFMMTLDVGLDVADKSGLCYYHEDELSVSSYTDIIGLEDPLYAINTNNKGARYIADCNPNLTQDSLADCSDINLSCYMVSNSSKYSYPCSSLPDGPSFFDRLNGNLSLSDKYRNLALSRFGRDDVGLETVLDLNTLEAYGMDVNSSLSWVDYLYWSGVEGTQVPGVQPSCDYSYLHLDCQHAYYYGLNSSTWP